MNPSRVQQHDIAKYANRSSPSFNELTPLPADYIPGPLDVICARGKLATNHSGNRRYNVIIDMNLQQYADAKTKMEKSLIVSSIVDSIREASPQAGFIKQKSGKWFIVGEIAAREKVGQSLRNLLQSKSLSSVKGSKTIKKADISAESKFEAPGGTQIDAKKQGKLCLGKSSDLMNSAYNSKRKCCLLMGQLSFMLSKASDIEAAKHHDEKGFAKILSKNEDSKQAKSSLADLMTPKFCPSSDKLSESEKEFKRNLATLSQAATHPQLGANPFELEIHQSMLPMRQKDNLNLLSPCVGEHDNDDESIESIDEYVIEDKKPSPDKS